MEATIGMSTYPLPFQLWADKYETGERLAVSDLARAAGLSVSQLQREFLRLLAMTPSAYITKVRVLMARRALERSDRAVGGIALDLGFYDQSHFTRVFRQQTGLTPLAYRQRFRS